MANRATLLVLSVIAALLAVILIIDATRSGRVERTDRILADVDLASVERVTLRQGERAPVVLARSDAGDLELIEPVEAPVDPEAIADLRGTLELLAFRRRLAADEGREKERGLAPPRATVELAWPGGRVVTLAIGADLEGVDRAWLRRDGRAHHYVIDGYAARSLSRSVADLRSRRPLPFRRAEVTGLELHAGAGDLVLSGRPLRVHREQGGAVRADPERAAELVERLHLLRLVDFAEPVADGEAGPEALSVRVIADGPPVLLVELGPCPGSADLRLVRSSAGVGCVPRAELEAIRGFVDDPEALLDRRLVHAGSAAIERVEVEGPAIAGRLELTAHGSAWRLSHDGGEASPADRDVVLTWLAELGASPTGARVPLAEVELEPPVLSLQVVPRGGAETEHIAIHRHRDRGLLARRGDEPVLWRLGAPSVEALVPPGRFRSRQLVAEEAWALREVRGRAGARVVQHLVRGELMSDWSVRMPAGAEVAPETVAALRGALSSVRAERFAGGAEPTGLGAPRRVVEAVFDPRPGEASPARHTIELGAAAADGCYARVDGGAAVVLDAGRCRTLLEDWAR